MKSLLALVPVYQNVPAPGFRSLMSLAKNGSQFFNFNYLIHTGSYIPVARNILFKAAYDLGPDYILCIDTDQVFNIQQVLGLVRHYDESDCDILSGDILIRNDKPGAPEKHMAYDLDPDGHVIWKELRPGINQVDGAGFGFLLMSGEVLKKLIESRDKVLFDTSIDSDLLEVPFRYTGEDVFFYRLVKKLGLKVGIDTDIKIGHFGFSK